MSAEEMKGKLFRLTGDQAVRLITRAVETMRAAIQDIDDGYDGSAKLKLQVLLGELFDPEGTRKAYEEAKKMEDAS